MDEVYLSSPSETRVKSSRTYGLLLKAHQKRLDYDFNVCRMIVDLHGVHVHEEHHLYQSDEEPTRSSTMEGQTMQKDISEERKSSTTRTISSLQKSHSTSAICSENYLTSTDKVGSFI